MRRGFSYGTLLCVLALSSCGGGGAATYYMHRNTTLGQELNDLQAAHQKGAIDDEEYAAQRARLLKGEERLER